ncbi:MAG TPA: cadherin-like beta sandwich domain-containing protein, partial [Anaerolineales bacterium]|nr:cadherin-like beta sandwich domain-containing protein [Anaerolineales bacterium]
MNKKWFLVGLIFILLVGVLLSVRALAASKYGLSWWKVAGGGMNGQASRYSLWGTAGPSNPQVSLAGSRTVASGLWGSAARSADLSNLAFSTGALDPAFDPGMFTYTQSVGNAVTSLMIIPVAADPSAAITLNGTWLPSAHASKAIDLAVGENIFTLVVTAPDGATVKRYTVTVARAASSNADLRGLVFSTGMLTPAFDPGVTGYAQYVGEEVTSLTVTPALADSTATIAIDGTPLAPGSSTGPIGLS